MTCREFLDFIMDYLDGTLPDEEQRPFQAHLAVCPDCERYLSQYRVTATAGRAALDPEGDVPDDVPEELVRAVLASRRH
jgi:anti-sigma factor RsiW